MYALELQILKNGESSTVDHTDFGSARLPAVARHDGPNVVPGDEEANKASSRAEVDNEAGGEISVDSPEELFSVFDSPEELSGAPQVGSGRAISPPARCASLTAGEKAASSGDGVREKRDVISRGDALRQRHTPAVAGGASGSSSDKPDGSAQDSVRYHLKMLQLLRIFSPTNEPRALQWLWT